MGLEIIWAEEAENDFFEIMDYVAQHNVQVALNLDDRVHEAIDLVALQPEIGLKTSRPVLRECILPDTHLVIIYAILNQYLLVLHIIGMRTDWKKDFHY